MKAQADQTTNPKAQLFELIQTSNYEAVFTLCQDAQVNKKLLGLIGYTGAGKSTALKEFSRSERNVCYVESKNIMNRKQFFQEVLKQLGLQFAGTVYDMVNRIIDEFNSQNSPLLIIDEAGKLSHTLMLDLHDLRNATMDNLGIVIAGCEYFKDNLEKAANKDKQGVPEFYSRIAAWQILNRPTKQEIKAICEFNGIQIPEIIKEIQKSKNYREVYNLITNQWYILKGL